MDNGVLRDAILYVLNGGAGAVVGWLFEHVAFLKEWLGGLRDDYARYVTWGASILVTLLLWGVALAMTYEPVPVDWRAAIERIFALAALSITGSQVYHAVTVLRNHD